ncbi:hypothetical protein GCM10027277_49360 [Pseudoduganella ginsengisoli]|uniref:DUF1003 domain-containing protein n=1 Tax=Pseudoduganella ginsengisoli TaxID=1462440 RepID=A0A6L6Q4W0_9BURK|nr:DUF1003 domain-containing protein [Pseudoduganella ginsengisoli]MTW04556.1 DUF1003 domain-containing protein [Pseudoduganella ginsengisoli]
MKNHEDLSRELLGVPYESLDELSQHVLRRTAGRRHIARNTVRAQEEQLSLGERAADAVARFGGSWAFIAVFSTVMVGWTAVNSFLLTRIGQQPFDPFPYILLNLMLSMLAAVQAPVLLMSQNRQGQKDRDNAEHDYEVNLKAELEIMLLHQKIDVLREKQWAELVSMQHDQLELLRRLAQQGPAA